MRARRVLLSGLTALALWHGSGPARADVFGPIELASSGVLAIPGGTGARQQALFAHDPVVSADSRYVAFDGYVGGYSGVWRRDLQTGEIAPVAVGLVQPNSEVCESEQPTCDAALPSISEEGRYVSFTTRSPLEPQLQGEHEHRPNVYVRDMDAPVSIQAMEAPSANACETSGEPRACPFTLVSAENGSGRGLTYSASEEGFGSVAAGRSAMSASGEKVAFVTTSVSDLAGASTPAYEVAVRNLNTRETELVSVEDEPATGMPKVPATPASATQSGTPFGAVDASGAGPFPFENGFKLRSAVGASISADGSTVAWMGQSVFRQARVLAEEETQAESASYVEPLWRRIADGPSAPTRRVTGGSEPENPACAASGETQLRFVGEAALADPCQGPFQFESAGVYNGSTLQAVPQLSADGYSVAFLGTASLVSLGQNSGLGGSERTADLYLADMRGGESRSQALRPLTQASSGAFAGNAAVVDFTLAPNGEQVAFSTQRIQFPLGSPAYISQPMATPEMAELFDVDIENDTLTRVTHGYEGGASERPHKEQVGAPPYQFLTDGALSPSFSADGSRLVFASTAANLVSGDGNTPAAGVENGLADGSDAFVVEHVAFLPTPVEAGISGAPPGPAVAPEFTLSVTERSLRNGKVVLYVRVPGPGRLAASAQGSVPVATAARRPHGGRSRVVRMLSRGVASAATSAAPNGEGIEQLTLALKSSYRALASRRGGLHATVEVVFNAPGALRLSDRIKVSFLGPPPRPAHRASRGRR